MELTTLYQELDIRTITLSLNEQGKLKCDAPKGQMTPDIVDAIKEHKAALLASLTGTETLLLDTKHIEIIDGVRVYFGYPDSEYKELLRQEYPPVPLGARCEVCLHQEALTIWKFGKRYCKECRERDEEKLYPDDTLPCDEQAPTDERSRYISSDDRTHSNTVTNEIKSPAYYSKREKKQRVTVYVDISQCQVTIDGTIITLASHCTLSQLLTITQEHCTYDMLRIYVCGELPPDYRAWLTGAEMWKEYTTGKRGLYFDAKKDTGHVARYEHRVSHKEVEVRTMDSWLGDSEYTVEQAHTAMSLLNQYLAGTFTSDTITYATPAQTFQQTWQRENRLASKKFELLPDDIRTLIHKSTGQGRIELCTPDKVSKISGLYYYDGIFEYAALTWGMPTELGTHDDKNEYAGKVPARYRIRYTVPMDWKHLGLFMTPRELVTGRAEDNEAWAYPGEDCQGRTFETWVDGSELDVAYNLPDGMPKWDITILERIVFKSEKQSATKKPLDTITAKLVKLREKVETDASTDTARSAIYKLVRGMIRNILLHGIGSFHRNNRDVTYILPADEAPDGFTGVPRPFAGDLFIYTVLEKTEAHTQQFEHPEWAALIWARCRARMVKAALSLPREQIVAIRTDAIAVTHEQPQWNENTKIGTLRQKWSIRKQLKAPHDFDTLDKLVYQHIEKGGK